MNGRACAYRDGNGERTLVETSAEADGRFRLGPLPTGPSREIWCDADGLARVRVGDRCNGQVAVFADAEHDLGDVVLVPGARLAARVVDRHGNPVSGASVIITTRYFLHAHTVTDNGPPIEVVTDADGRLPVATSLPPAESQLTVDAPGRARVRRDASVRADQHALALGAIEVPDGLVVVRGRVIDDDESPVADARVIATLDGSECRTDAGGWFELRTRDAQMGSLDVRKDGYTGLGWSVSDESPETLELTLSRERWLHGSVRDAETDALLPIDDVGACVILEQYPGGPRSYAG